MDLYEELKNSNDRYCFNNCFEMLPNKINILRKLIKDNFPEMYEELYLTNIEDTAIYFANFSLLKISYNYNKNCIELIRENSDEPFLYTSNFEGKFKILLISNCIFIIEKEDGKNNRIVIDIFKNNIGLTKDDIDSININLNL